ncbi:heavy metal translocating P-type ATPase, partial [bacterium]|nr:heavy metal translocating P-type ATPase [bacterium]
MSDEKTVYLPIVGMHCASCVGRVQNALDRVPGARAEVNFGTESARVSYDPDRISPRELVGAVDGVGYRVGTARIEMPIEGMHCASCVTRVEKALKTAPGVLDASVNLALERAIVDGIAGAFSWDDLKARVESAGSYRVADAAASGDAADPAHARRAETRSLVRRLVVGIALGAPVVADMIAHMAGVHPFGGAARPWILLALTAPVFAYSGWPFHRGLIASLRHRTADMNTLISLGTSVAFFESFLNTAWPSLMRHPGAGGHFNYDSAIMIIVLILVGRITESRSKAEASGAIRALLELAPRKALARRDADWREVDAASLRPGDIVRLRPGEAVAADGVVTEGRTWVDESMLTGESRPVAKQIGDAIIGGTVNQSGAVVYEVRRTGDATVLAKIIRAVRDAQAHKPRVQRLADKIASVFVPAVITIAALAFTAWLVFGPEPALPLALLSATAVLIIACPCALGLATPTAIMVGTGVAARLGILIRGGESLELARRLDTIVFDKTGTLTRGEMSVTRVTPAEGFDAADVLAAAAAIERASEHPIARAIVAAATPGDAAIV